MVRLSPFMEKVFYLLTFISQGTSFLNPKAYGYMHSLHHKHSDTPKDPHSPHNHPSVYKMMWQTFEYYEGLLSKKIEIPDDYKSVEWKALDKFADSWITRISWVLVYTLFYLWIAPSFWFLLLVPVHAMMGPIHGMIVNWCGHKYGYQNYDLPDQSKNTLPIVFLMMGELYQNNHHRYAMDLNFAKKWYEIDFGYVIIYLLTQLNIIKPLKSKESVRSTDDRYIIAKGIDS